MKILWLGNIILPKIFELNSEKNKSYVGGWLDGMSESLLERKNVELVYCYPNYQDDLVKENREDNFLSYGIPMKYNEAIKLLNINSRAVKIFEEILCRENPDIIHFWGTEFLYSWNFFQKARDLGYKKKCIVSIQGLVSVYAQHYEADLPHKVINSCTLSEIKGKCTLRDNKKSFIFLGKSEVLLLQNIPNVIGRTSWDKACVELINPSIKYFKCNESLRKPFYENEWNIEKCTRCQIFISQGSYPIKGLHKVLQAVNYIKKQFPTITIKVAGANIFQGNCIKGNTYGRYIKSLIKKYGLEENVEFLGMVDAEEMKNNLLKCNLFVCPSAIENSPNSLGEAMLLGVPCIASDVGGCADMMCHEVEGFIYPFNETYKLSWYMKRIFENDSLAVKLGKAAKEKAELTHDRKKNNLVLYNVYKEVLIDSMSSER